MQEKVIKILLVEDEDDYRKMAEYMLGKIEEKVEIETVASLASAFECLRRGGINLILLDLNLPDSKGLDTVHQMLKKAGNIPIVVFTVIDDVDLAVAAVHAGAQDYLVKGDYDFRLFHQAIHDALARSSK
jgi:DNA-binding NtrC family response regulator